MEITREERQRIEANLGEKYERVAAGQPGQFRYPTGRAGLDGLGYRPRWLARLPMPVQGCFCGVGNPFAMGLPEPGWTVLDVGAGCGVDTLVAAGLVGSDGLAVGLERSFAMVARARDNARIAAAPGAAFASGSAEALPFEDGRFDLVISSGVYNLVIDKERALAEAFRVLKPGGRLQVADQILTGAAPRSQEEVVASWFT